MILWCVLVAIGLFCFFFKQKTAYEVRISDWSSDVCSSDLQLAFDIGRLEVSVGDLASLQPGYVFALPAQLQGANVTIRANGRTAGRGEGGRMGTRHRVALVSGGVAPGPRVW